MARGTTKAKVHDVFSKRLEELRERGADVSEGLQGSGQRKWYIPTDLKAEDLFDLAKLHEPSFDRTEANTNYVECFQDKAGPGTTADVVSLKRQVDYNAAEERAFRFRHASPCRCLVHAACRRHFHDSGPVFAYVRQVEEDIIRAGGVT
jgi:hypothetical protein